MGAVHGTAIVAAFKTADRTVFEPDVDGAARDGCVRADAVQEPMGQRAVVEGVVEEACFVFEATAVFREIARHAQSIAETVVVVIAEPVVVAQGFRSPTVVARAGPVREMPRKREGHLLRLPGVQPEPLRCRGKPGPPRSRRAFLRAFHFAALGEPRPETPEVIP